MGEPTCLMRSFSHPSSTSRETKEGDPFRALTESISFGRFMSESLAWEKWSTFSHNRYLEEVEQFSKPGSVAQKKAFFEAHYKKRAAMKAAALLEQPNATVSSSIPEEEMAVSNVPETETTVNSSIPEEEMAVSYVPVTETTVNCSIPEEETRIDSVPETENMDIDSLSKEATVDIGNNLNSGKDSLQDEKLLDKVESCGKIAASPEEKKPIKEAAERGSVALQKNNAALPINKRQMNSSLKSSSQNKASKIPKSINLSYHSGLTSKGSIRMSKDCSSPKTSARECVYGISKLLPSVSCQPDDKSRAKSNGSKARSPIISSPFRFRSEERAAKRIEFFQKLEEKNNLKTHTQVKSKVPLTRPRSPKLGRRPSVNAERLKRIIPKSNQSTTCSITLLPKKKAHENASPNIQL